MLENQVGENQVVKIASVWRHALLNTNGRISGQPPRTLFRAAWSRENYGAAAGGLERHLRSDAAHCASTPGYLCP